MSIQTDVDNAIRRAEAKSKAQRALAKLGPADRRAVLAELFVEEDVQAGKTPLSENHPDNGDRAETTAAKLIDEVIDGGGRTATLVDMLQKAPGTSIRDLAVHVYRSDDRGAQTKVRSILWSLSKQKRVRQIDGERGKWEVVEPE